MRTTLAPDAVAADRRALWWRWVAIVSTGELLGFGVPALVGVWSQDLPGVQQVPALMAAGLVEGGLLGLAQALVLRRQLVGFRTAAWVCATSAAAAFAYLLGMLPSTTHDWWSGWPVGLLAAVALALGILLLLSIGIAQAWVLPRGTPRTRAWVGWTALGWCAGLVAFSVVAPPLWHEGQRPAVTVLIGLAGGTAMAVVMAAVTGVGVLRLCSRAVADQRHEGDRVRVSSLLGTQVFDEHGDRLGRVADLVVDLAVDLDRVPVTSVLVGGRGGREYAVSWSRLSSRPDGPGVVLTGSAGPAEDLASSAVLVGRDILDSPVVLADPPRRARVSDVVLDVDRAGAWLVELDVSTSGAMRRLLGPSGSPEVADPVRLSQVHLASPAGHAAQLAVPEALVFRLGPAGMAEVLTRVSVIHARDILRVADRAVLDEALSLLHPHVRSRVTGASAPPRRARRTSGWRLHRPGSGSRSGTGK